MAHQSDFEAQLEANDGNVSPQDSARSTRHRGNLPFPFVSATIATSDDARQVSMQCSL